MRSVALASKNFQRPSSGAKVEKEVELKSFFEPFFDSKKDRFGLFEINITNKTFNKLPIKCTISLCGSAAKILYFFLISRDAPPNGTD